jgi:hypothetical protein
MWVMALIGSAPGLRCSCRGTLLVGKDVQPLQSVKPIRIAMSTVLDEPRCGHKTSVLVWDVSHGVSCTSGKMCGCVLLLRTRSPVVPLWFSQNNLVTWVINLFAKTFSEMNPCMSK